MCQFIVVWFTDCHETNTSSMLCSTHVVILWNSVCHPVCVCIFVCTHICGLYFNSSEAIEYYKLFWGIYYNLRLSFLSIFIRKNVFSFWMYSAWNVLNKHFIMLVSHYSSLRPPWPNKVLYSLWKFLFSVTASQNTKMPWSCQLLEESNGA